MCTDQCFAVVVEADALADARQRVEFAEESAGRLGGLFGKGKQHVRPERALETWWQHPIGQIREFTSAELGRCADPIEFFRVRFADNSDLGFRMLNAADLVTTVRERHR